MDIIFGDNMKKELRLTMWYLRHKLKKDYNMTLDEIRYDMDNCGNPAISKIWNEIKSASNKINETYQKDIAIEFPMVILWIIYKDTAYIDPFTYVLTKLVDDKKFVNDIKKYYKEPEDWYITTWTRTKQKSSDLKKTGEIPDMEGMMGFDEKIFVPEYQDTEVNKINKKIEEERKKVKWNKV